MKDIDIGAMLAFIESFEAGHVNNEGMLQVAKGYPLLFHLVKIFAVQDAYGLKVDAAELLYHYCGVLYFALELLERSNPPACMVENGGASGSQNDKG